MKKPTNDPNKRLMAFGLSLLVEELNYLAYSCRRLEKTLRKVLILRGVKFKKKNNKRSGNA